MDMGLHQLDLLWESAGESGVLVWLTASEGSAAAGFLYCFGSAGSQTLMMVRVHGWTK